MPKTRPAVPKTSSRMGRGGGSTANPFRQVGRGRTTKQIDGLTGVELDSASALELYCRRLADIGNALAFELDMAQRELEANLSNMPGMKLFGAQARVKARIVTRHLKAGADTAAHLRTVAQRTLMSYRKHFAPASRTRGKVFDPQR